MQKRSLGFGHEQGGIDNDNTPDESPPTTEGDIIISTPPPVFEPPVSGGGTDGGAGLLPEANTLLRMKQLTGTTAEWASCDIIVGRGEIALEIHKDNSTTVKIGNGVKRYSALPYYIGSSAGGTGIGSASVWQDDGNDGIYYNGIGAESKVTVGTVTSTSTAKFNVTGRAHITQNLSVGRNAYIIGDITAANATFSEHVNGAKDAIFKGSITGAELTATNQGDPVGGTQVPALLDQNGKIVRGANVVFGMTHTLPGGDVVTRFTAADGNAYPIDMVGQNIVNLPDATTSPSNYDLTNFGGNIAASVKWVENKFGSIVGANFKGTLDLRDGGDAVPTAGGSGDWVVVRDDTYDANGVNTGMMSDAWWKSLAAASQQARMREDGTFDKSVYAGDDLFYDGTKWHYVSASQHHNKFVSRYGDTMAGTLKFLRRTSAAGARPATYAGHGFDVGCSGATFVSDGIAYQGGDFFKVQTNGGAAASMVGFETNEGGGTKYHTTMIGGNGSLRLAVSGSAYMPPGSPYQQALQGHIGCFTGVGGRPMMRFTFKHDQTNTETAGGFEFNSWIRVGGQIAIHPAAAGNHAVTLGQANGLYLAKTGGDFSGNIHLTGGMLYGIADPTHATGAVPWGYAEKRYLKLTGGNMTGTINMGGSRIINVGNPTDDTNAASAGYVKDTALCRSGGSANYTAKNAMILNLMTPQHDDHAANKGYVDSKVSAISDRRAKENVADYAGGLAAVEAINVVNFNYSVDAIRSIEGDETFWSEDNVPKETQCGVIAQDLEAVFPQAVTTSDLGMKSVDYAKLVPVLLSAIQELSDELKALKKGLE